MLCVRNSPSNQEYFETKANARSVSWHSVSCPLKNTKPSDLAAETRLTQTLM